jgi:hypothetical protein
LPATDGRNLNQTRIPKSNPEGDVAESLAFDGLERRKTIVEAWAIPVPVASIDDLIAMKRLAARPQDVQDIEALLELKGL